MKKIINELGLLKVKLKDSQFFIDFNGAGSILFLHNKIITSNIFKDNKDSVKKLSTSLYSYKKYFEILKINVVYYNKIMEANPKRAFSFKTMSKITEDLNNLIDYLINEGFSDLLKKRNKNIAEINENYNSLSNIGSEVKMSPNKQNNELIAIFLKVKII